MPRLGLHVQSFRHGKSVLSSFCASVSDDLKVNIFATVKLLLRMPVLFVICVQTE